MTFRDMALLVGGVLLATVIAMVFTGVVQAVGVASGPAYSLALLLIFFGVPIALYYGVRATKARERTRVAQANGLTLTAEPDENLRRCLTVFPAFSRPSGKMVGDRLGVVRDGVDVTVFDYSYMSVPNTFGLLLGSFAAHPRLETAVLCRCQGMIFPQFSLHSRKIVRGEQGVFEQSPGEEVLMPLEFFKKYSLRGISTDRIRPLFTPELVSYYLQQRGLHTEATGNLLIVYRPHRQVGAEDLMPAVDEAIMLVDRFRAAMSES